MGPQVAERDSVASPALLAEAAAERTGDRRDGGSLAEDAALVIGWPQTIRTLLRVVRPYRGQWR